MISSAILNQISVPILRTNFRVLVLDFEKRYGDLCVENFPSQILKELLEELWRILEILDTIILVILKVLVNRCSGIDKEFAWKGNVKVRVAHHLITLPKVKIKKYTDRSWQTV